MYRSLIEKRKNYTGRSNEIAACSMDGRDVFRFRQNRNLANLTYVIGRSFQIPEKARDSPLRCCQNCVPSLPITENRNGHEIRVVRRQKSSRISTRVVGIFRFQTVPHEQRGDMSIYRDGFRNGPDVYINVRTRSAMFFYIKKNTNSPPLKWSRW